MIKVLLADDNKLALDHLTQLVRERDDEFEVVACMENGAGALAAFERYQPQLVITDVCMPGMSGIDLAREIKRMAPETVIIFLSNYEEFEYVRSAMDLGVFDYILKHENIQKKLGEKLTAVKKILRRKPQTVKFSEEGWLQSFWSQMEHDGSQAIREQAQEIFPEQYDFFLMEQDCFLPPICELLQTETQEVSDRNVKDICYLHFKQAVAVVRYEKYRYLLMMRRGKEENAAAYKIKEKLQENLYTSFSVLIVCENAPILEGLSLSWSSRDMLDQRYFYPMSVVLNRSTMQRAKEKGSPTQYLDGKKFEYNLLKNRIHELCEQMDAAYLDIIRKRDIPGLFEFLRTLISFLLPYHQKVMDYKKGGSFVLYQETTVESWYSADDTFYWLKQKYMQLAQIQENNSFFNYSAQVQAAIKYINGHYMEVDIGAEDVAEQAGLSVNRLNTLMKEETGSTVWKFLTKVRVEKAKQLLDSTGYTIAEICPMVGYSTSSYFSKIFKKTNGVSPQKYRSMKDDAQKAEI